VSFDVVVATDSERGIGKDGRLPWRLAHDLRYFRELTTAVSKAGARNAVIMGRKTWESIPPGHRPLPDRVNVVVTRDPVYALPEQVLRAASFDQALEALQGLAVENCFVIGGGEIYRLALKHPRCRRLFVTEVASRFECDTFFPEYRGDFVLESSSEPKRDNGLQYSFKTYKRKGAF